MGKRWGIASDPKVLARIAAQEDRRGAMRGSDGLAKASRVPVAIDTGLAKERPPSAATQRAKRVAINNQDSRKDTLTYDGNSNTLTIILAGAQLLSENTSLRMHNAKATQLKTTWLKRIEALMLLNLEVYDQWKTNQVRAFPLIVEEVYVTAENNCLDVESVCAACKPIIDALVRTRFIPDDKREYIAQPIAYTFRQPNNGLVLVLRPAPKPWGMISDSTIALAQDMPTMPSV